MNLTAFQEGMVTALAKEWLDTEVRWAGNPYEHAGPASSWQLGYDRGEQLLGLLLSEQVTSEAS